MAELEKTFQTVPAAAAGVMGLSAFAASLGVAIVSGVSGPDAILRALACMAACYGIGWAMGLCGRIACREHVDAQVASRPIPEIPQIHIPDPSDKQGGAS